MPARSGLMTVSWVLLLSALVTPLLVDGPGWFGTTRPVMHSGGYLLQAYVAQILVFAALGCFAASSLTRAPRWRWHRSMGLVAGLLGWTALATLLSPSPASALLGLPVESQGLLLRIVATAVLLLTVESVDGTARIRVAARVLGLVGAASAALGLLQLSGSALVGASAGIGFGRSFGTLGNPDMFGGFILFSLFISLGVALSETTLPWRALMWAATAVCATAVVTSYSRAAWVGIVVGAAAFALLVWKARLRIDVRLVAALVAVVLTVGAAAALRPSQAGSATDIGHRLTSLTSMRDPDSAARLEIWASTLRAVARRPLQGYGPDTMVLASEPVRSVRLARLVDPRQVMESAHSLPLQTMSDLGIPGFLLWAGMLAVVAVSSWRAIVRGRDGSSPARLVVAGLWASCAAYLADSLFTPSSVAGTLTLFCVLGLLIAPSASDRPFAGRTFTRVLAGAAIAIALGGMVIGFAFLAADRQASVANDAGTSEALRADAGTTAVRLNPLSTDYAALDAAVLFSLVDTGIKTGADPAVTRARFDAAVTQARRAVAIEPTNQRRLSFLASILSAGAVYFDKGLLEEALSDYATAMQMSPNDLYTRTSYARALRTVDPPEARAVLRGVLSLRPDYAAAAVALSDIDVSSGDPAAARRVLRTALDASVDPADRASLERSLLAIP